MNNESDLKTIMELGQGAVDSLAKAIKNVSFAPPSSSILVFSLDTKLEV